MRFLSGLVLALIMGSMMMDTATAGEWDFELGAELRYLPQDPPYGVKEHAASVSARAEYFQDWNDGADFLEFDAFYRWSEADDERTHGDIQDLAWFHVADTWELRSGIRTVFWGVTEFQHLVDIVNQADSVERNDGEAKLGQPMVNLSVVSDWGIFDVYALVGFRERTFPGADGWPRGPVVLSSSDADYESGAEDKHLDFAARWTKSLDQWELSYFGGTARDPEFSRVNDGGELVPYYRLIEQVGLEVQYNIDAWLWKMEALTRTGTASGRYFASVFGFEYTFEGLWGSVSDLGVVSEYNYDERGKESPASYFLENDLALGLRWALNDEANSEMLAGVIYDHKTHERVFSVEANRRLGDVWKISLDATFFHSSPPPSLDDINNGSFDPIYKLATSSHNDMIQLELIRYF
jgi:hypothetical protein